MNSFELYRENFKDLFETVRKAHESSPLAHNGHGLDHDVTVASFALQIAPDEETAAKAWCAAMIHSADHLIESEEKLPETLRGFLGHLPKGKFKGEEVEEIFQAALHHSELNNDEQSLTQQVLMDADRLTNMLLSVVIRAGQFRPKIPAVEFEYLQGAPNPRSTYRKPCSVLDNLRGIIEAFIPQFRLPKAKELSQTYTERLNAFISQVEKDYEDLGLIDISLT